MSKIAVVYWSNTGNTETMANAIVKGIQEVGTDAELFEVSSAPKDLSGYDKVAFGCPSMGVEELEDSVFEPYYIEAESSLAGKKAALFGSYGWGDGEWMRNWAKRAKDNQIDLLDDGLAQQEDARDEEECAAYGAKLATY